MACDLLQWINGVRRFGKWNSKSISPTSASLLSESRVRVESHEGHMETVYIHSDRFSDKVSNG